MVSVGVRLCWGEGGGNEWVLMCWCVCLCVRVLLCAVLGEGFAGGGRERAGVLVCVEVGWLLCLCV